MRKCRRRPSAAVFAPPWNDLGPSIPEATDCNTWLGRKWNCRPNAIKACVISKTPHASPPQKMARKALEEGEGMATCSKLVWHCSDQHQRIALSICHDSHQTALPSVHPQQENSIEDMPFQAQSKRYGL